MRFRPAAPATSIAVLAAVLPFSSAALGDTNYWEPNGSTFWHFPLNWSTFTLPTASTDVSINPYFAPHDTVLIIDPTFGAATAGNVVCRDWNCPPAGCDFNALIVPLAYPIQRAELNIEHELRSRATWSHLFGDGESNLTVMGIDMRLRSLTTDEESGADATMRLVDTTATFLSGGSGVNVSFGTELWLNASTLTHQSGAERWDLVVAPGAVLFTEGVECRLQHCAMTLLGTISCFGDLRTNSLGGFGAVSLLTGNLIVDGSDHSLFLGSIGGVGSVTKEGSGTLVLTGQLKTQLGGLNINGGRVYASAGNQLGLGAIHMNGGGLGPSDVPLDIEEQSIVLQAGGGTLDVYDLDLTISTVISGSGMLTKSGPGTASIHGVSTYTGGTLVQDGILEVNNSTGSGTGTGQVVVAAGGTLSGIGAAGGEVIVQDGGVTAPGFAESTVALLRAGALTFETGATHKVRIFGTATYDRLAASGAVTIEPGATLEIDVAPGFEPGPGAEYLLIDTDAVSGVFDTLIADGDWCVTVTAEGLVIRYQGDCAGCPTDLDGDGETGFTELLAVLSVWGTCPGCVEDLDGDGEVAFGDLLAVLSAWGPCD